MIILNQNTLALLYVYFLSSSHINLSLSSKLSSSLYHHNNLTKMISGKFNNLLQSRMDSYLGRETARKGGHEFITVNIQKFKSVSCENVFLAHYHYGIDPLDTFRLRCYEFPLPRLGADTEKKTELLMKIYKLNPLIESKFKDNFYDLSKYSINFITDCEYMENCDVNWTPIFIQGEFSNQYKGELVLNGCEIKSQNDPNKILIVYDELKLNRNNLYINDRIYLKNSGEQIIGNSKGIPYKLSRINI